MTAKPTRTRTGLAKTGIPREERDTVNKEIDIRMSHVMDRLGSLACEVASLERRSDIWGSRQWREALPQDHPKKLELAALESELDALRACRPVDPIHAEIGAEFGAAVRGDVSDRVAELLRGSAV